MTLLDPRPGSLTGPSHVTGSGVRYSFGSDALAAKGLAVDVLDSLGVAASDHTRR